MEQNGSSYSEGTTLKQTGPCQYPSLTCLTLFRSPNLKHMRGLKRFPSLKSLKLSEMASLEELWTIASGIEIQEVELSAQYCFQALSSLESLVLRAGLMVTPARRRLKRQISSRKVRWWWIPRTIQSSAESAGNVEQRERSLAGAQCKSPASAGVE